MKFLGSRAYVKSQDKENDLRLVIELVSGLSTQNVTWFSSVISWHYEANDPYVAFIYQKPNSSDRFHLRVNASGSITTAMLKDGVWTDHGKLAYDSEKQQAFITHQQIVTLEKDVLKCDLAADTIGGYDFFCWIACASKGWVGAPYIELPFEKTTRVWDHTKYGGEVLCCSLYKKTPTAINFN